MELHERERLLYRILSGKTILRSSRLDVLSPSLDLLYEAEDLYCHYYNQPGVLTRDDLRKKLAENNLIKFDDLSYLDGYLKLVENLQKEIYLKFYDPINCDKVRALLSQARNKYSNILNNLAKYDTYSKECMSSYIKSIFLIRNTTYENGKLYDFSKKTPINILEELNSLTISNNDIRDVAKKSSWTNIWFSCKNFPIFSNIPSQEQQLLVMWSKIYDNVRESSDAPSEDIIDDNDALDGWLVIQNEESKQKKKENFNNKKINSKINNADEVFIVARNKEEIDRINSMNSEHAKRVKNDRMSQINSAGSIEYHNFKDVRLDIQAQFHRMQMEHISGKKN